MKNRKKYIEEEMNRRGKARSPFAFLIDFAMLEPLFFELNHNTSEICWQTPLHSNCPTKQLPAQSIEWEAEPVTKERYTEAFSRVQEEIHEGNTYLLNLTFPSRIHTNLSMEEIFHRSEALYKIWLKDRFVCFSPEIFVRISDGIISSNPMKGTIDARINNAEVILKNDRKELAEHNTIVDLIRNDLSLVADQVEVESFRYIDRIRNNRGELLQMSSKIRGLLPANYLDQLGTIITRMLPAGSICGAPKKKTVEIIEAAEQYQRGYYTGIFGIFDGERLDSCVLIRFLEQNNNELLFKSGGGITFLSKCDDEYNELKQKVYVPFA